MPAATLRFPGLGICGYRSLSEPTWIDLSGRFNVIIGANNSGKSNVLRLLYKHLLPMWQSVRFGSVVASFDEKLDASRDSDGSITVYWPIDSYRASSEADILASVLETSTISGLGSVPLLPLKSLTTSAPNFGVDGVEITDDHPEVPWGRISDALTRNQGGEHGADAARVLNWIRQNALVAPPLVAVVPPSRSIGRGDAPEWDFSGVGIVDRLNELRNADFDQPELLERYNVLCHLLGVLFEDSTFDYIVPSHRKTINVRLSNQYYPLDSLGTGTGHVVLLVAAAIVYPDHLLCIEEPDAHLHPRLQRRVANLLRETSTAQVVVATHSAHWIDLSLDNVLHVRKVGNCSEVSAINYPNIFLRLAELGYRASDILQTNCIIWVEGPSDRIYLRHWVSSLAPDLIEGVHYSIMFFGGALLGHLQARLDADLSDPSLVDLWRLNQQMWLVVDSDRAEGSSPLKARVQRLQDEVRAFGRGGVWVTAGRTFENYIPLPILEAAVKQVHPAVDHIDPVEGADLLTRCMKSDGCGPLRHIDKVAVAGAVTATWDNPEESDLRERLDDLLAFVRSSNL